jgi:hypothetical protein
MNAGHPSMKTEFVQKIHLLTNRIVYFRSPNWLIYFYVIALCLAYIVVTAHTPLTLYPDASHDDGLAMSLGRSLAEGKWLGRYSQFTLMKGPGYPAFLALANWLGISASLAHALFRCAAVVFFVAVANRFIKSYLMSGLLLALLLWHPVPTSVYMDRVGRDQIYPGQVLIVFAAAAGALFYAREMKQKIVFAALTGFFLGWVWLTREEGIWILPAAVLLVGAATVHAFSGRRLRQLAATLVAVLAIFASIQLAFRTANWVVYGKFVSVDFKETNFQRALRAIDSVRSGGTKPFVSITHAAMKRVDAVSPAFASLAPYFDGPGKGWEPFACRFYPAACGEVGAGWFVWALRAAASDAGHYASPVEASAFFGRIADEITSACARGALECSPQLIAEMPPVNWAEVVGRIPRLYARAFAYLFLLHPPIQLNPSSGTEADRAVALRFLNYPPHTRSIDIASKSTYRITGVYYKPGHKWFWATVTTPNGSPADVRVERNASPDTQAMFNDPEASQQRYAITTRCSDDCTLQLQSQDGEIVQKKLAEILHGPLEFALGQGHFYVDSTTVRADPADTEEWIEVVSGRIRRALLNNYQYVFVPVLIVGAVCFLAASSLYRRQALLNISYLFAVCSWVLAIIRMSILVLITATSFPALEPGYLWAANLLVVSGALFSCAAWLQLSGDARQRAHPTPLQDAARTFKAQVHKGCNRSGRDSHFLRNALCPGKEWLKNP